MFPLQNSVKPVAHAVLGIKIAEKYASNNKGKIHLQQYFLLVFKAPLS
jgi:hypothetical protein